MLGERHGGMKSMGMMHETASNSINAADRETNGDSSLAMIRSEVGHIRELAKCKLLQLVY